jgi:copper transport protein
VSIQRESPGIRKIHSAPNAGRIVLALVIVLLAIFRMPAGEASAHAVLLEADPAAGSRLELPPERITLTFNERLEDELYGIRVLDGNGEDVVSADAVLSDDRRTLSLELPPLADGLYTVSYKVISTDGHPIRASYIFTIGGGTAAESGAASGHLHDHEHGLSSGLSLSAAGIFAARILYYLSLLLVTGWIAWGIFRPIDPLAAFRKTYRRVSFNLRLFHLFALLPAIALVLPDYLASAQPEEVVKLLRTNVGLSWGIGLLLTLLSFPLLHRSRLLDTLWVILWPISETLNGHAMAAKPLAASAVLNAVHTAAAALWAGGLLYALLLFVKDKPAMYGFLPRLARAALISLIVLAVTGTAETWLMLPDLRLLPDTLWGRLLIAKAAVVALVVITALAIRNRMRRRLEDRLGPLLKLDFALMGIVTAIVGVFTYLSPIPANEPVFWHDVQGDVHLVTNIQPNQPGQPNRFDVEVWLPADAGAPRDVRLYLHMLDDAEVPPIEIPLAPEGSGEESDYLKHRYAAEGPYPPFAGRWQAEVRIIDPRDNEVVFRTEFRNYPVN